MAPCPGLHEQPTVAADLTLIRQGLQPRAVRPQRVLVIGAGLAGLVAAYELLRAGHEPEVLEVQGRVGGRVLTLRDPFAPGLYAELGAMRIPRSHRLTMAYVAGFGLPTRPFTMANPKAYIYHRGRRLRRAEAQAHPDLLAADLAEAERGRWVGDLWDEALRPLARLVSERGPADGWRILGPTGCVWRCALGRRVAFHRHLSCPSHESGDSHDSYSFAVSPLPGCHPGGHCAGNTWLHGR